MRPSPEPRQRLAHDGARHAQRIGQRFLGRQLAANLPEAHVKLQQKLPVCLIGQRLRAGHRVQRAVPVISPVAASSAAVSARAACVSADDRTPCAMSDLHPWQSKSCQQHDNIVGTSGKGLLLVFPGQRAAFSANAHSIWAKRLFGKVEFY